MRQLFDLAKRRTPEFLCPVDKATTRRVRTTAICVSSRSTPEVEMTRDPRGTVWIAQNPFRGRSRPGTFVACIIEQDQERIHPAEFATLEDAVSWGRSEADVVLVRPAGQAACSSAGRTRPFWLDQSGDRPGTSGDVGRRSGDHAPEPIRSRPESDGHVDYDLFDEDDVPDEIDEVTVEQFPSWDRDQY
jgi:hypothetical protein